MSSPTRRNIGIALSALILLSIFYYFADILTWLSIAWIVSMLGSPVMKLLGKIKIGKWKLGAGLRAGMVLLFFYSILGLFLYLFVPVIIQQGRNLAGVNYAAIMKSLEKPLSYASDWLIENGLTEGQLSKYATIRKDSIQKDTIQKDTTPIAIDTTPTNPIDTQSIVGDTSQNIPHKDTLNVNIVALDSGTHKTAILLNMDSMLLADQQNPHKKNLQVNITVSFDSPPKNPKKPTLDDDDDEEHHDSTAIVKPSDPFLESLKKQAFSFISPSRILAQTAGYLINFFGNFILIMSSVTFIAFFFLKDEELFARGIKAAIPDEYVGRVDATLARIRYMLTRYVGGILLQITVITIYVSIFLLILGIKNGLLIGFFAAISNVVPYVGPILGAIFGLIVTLSTNSEVDFYTEMLPMLIWVYVVFQSMQLLDNFILQPVIFSNSVLAHPLEIFIVIVAGAKVGGIWGMVVALPIYTIFRVIAASFLSEFKIIQELTQQLNENHHDQPDPTPPPPPITPAE